MKITFLIRALETGGAERQLVTLATGLQNLGHEVTVCVYYAGCGDLEGRLQRNGVTLVSLEKRGRWDVVGFSWRLLRHLRVIRPDVLHGYLATSNILVTIMGWLSPGPRIVWGIRASDMNLSAYDWTFKATFWLAGLLARHADQIVINSEAGRRYHICHGYPKASVSVIPNGIDTDQFVWDPAGRRRLREEWGITPTQPLIGMIARLDPIKDHSTFLRAARHLLDECEEVRFVCIGDGPAAYRKQLMDAAVSLGLGGYLVWTGERKDMPAIYSALDVVALTSTSEGFPNVLAEAMACGTPCVATGVGDSAAIIGSSESIVNIGDSESMARAWKAVLRYRDAVDREEIRRRIVEKFSMQNLVFTTDRLLAEIVGR